MVISYNADPATPPIRPSCQAIKQASSGDHGDSLHYWLWGDFGGVDCSGGWWSQRLSPLLTLRWLWLDVVVFIVVAVVDRDWLNFDHLISYISEGHVVNVDHNRGDTGRTHCAFHHGVGRGRGNRVHDHQVLSLSQVLSGKIALSCFAFYVKGDSHWDWQEEAICLFSMLSFSHKPAKHTKSLKQD